MLEALALPPLNRLLRTHTWALDRLRAHAGKTAFVTCRPLELRFSVTPTGELASALPDTAPDVAIGVTPGILLRAAARDSHAWGAAEVTGDAEFAEAIDYVRRNLQWDYEEDLSRIFGDIAAHRLASLAQQLDLWGRDTALKVGRTFAEYVTYERPLVASAHAVEQFNRQVDTLRDDAERLEKRLELLRRRLSGSE
jgi:ubiquinone biosynthesis protein UbiJ